MLIIISDPEHQRFFYDSHQCSEDARRTQQEGEEVMSFFPLLPHELGSHSFLEERNTFS